jgi:alkylation response protein AidB-like acyl-CoA dehydrogenase
MVSFMPSEDQKMIQDMARDFAINEIRSKARDCDEKDTVPESVLQAGWELGMVNAVLPADFGGSGMERSAVTGALMCEELAWGDLSVAMALLAPALFAYPVLEFGTDAQKKKYLPRFCEQKFVRATGALVEPAFDFDLSALKTKAEKKGNAYVINGQKCLVPLGNSSDLYLVWAALDGKPGYENVAGFIVEKGASGLKVLEREKNMGLKALETAELKLDNLKVPAENRLGADQGCNFGRIASLSRTALAAMAAGVGRSSFEYARQYAKDRVAFGEPIAHRQAIAFMLAEMAWEVDAVRLLAWEAAWELDQKREDAFKEAYLAKLYADQSVMWITDCGVQILGGHGYIREHPVELWLRNARGFAIFEGLVTV